MRDKFPIFQRHPNWIYLDSAATAHKPKCVIDALVQFYAEDYATVHRAIYQNARKASEDYHATRVCAAEFLHADPEEIVFTKGTTDAINLVAQNYAHFLKSGDEILVSEMEHHANLVPWQMAAKRSGAQLKWIPMNGEGVLEWEGTITPRTKVVAVGHISNVTGTINPIADIVEAAHRVGAHVVVDGAQAAPHIAIDVAALGCDFYAFSGHKCYGPTGVGILFGKKEHLLRMAPVQGGGDMIERVDFDETTYQVPPLRFEAGTPPIASVIALKEALHFVQAHRDVHPDLLPYATEKLAQIDGVKIIGSAKQKGPILTFHIAGIHPLDVATFLDLQDISVRSGHLCAQPLLRKFGLSAALRASFAVYNTRQEVDRFLFALNEAVCYHLPSNV